MNDHGIQPGDVTLARARLRRRAGIAGALLVALGIGAGAGWAIADRDGDDRPPPPAPPVVAEQAPEPEVAAELGFPGFATRNTTRVGGIDPVVDAVGVALASYPSFGGVGGPPAVALAPAGQWQASLIAASLAHESIGVPLLLGEPEGLPELAAEALEALAPTGLADGEQEIELIAIGEVDVPRGLEALRIEGDDPAELARAVARHRARLSGEGDPDHLLVVPSAEPALAMPAAAWAAVAGDPIVFADGDEVPDATLDVLERHPRAAAYVLGSLEAISPRAVRRLARDDREVRRIADTGDPVENAIEFAVFADGEFGFNLVDPGHGFVLANAARPGDAGAAASLSAAGGKPGPLLLTDDAAALPDALCNFLLDRKPGYRDDPLRAVFNHVWLIGDERAISIEQQARIEDLTRLERVRRGVRPGRCPEEEPDEAQPEDEDEDETEDEPETEDEVEDEPGVRGAGRAGLQAFDAG